MKQAYITKRFGQAALDTIQMANAIMAEYKAGGYSLTLRQLYYQFVARGYVENSVRSYKNLGRVISDGRMAGLIDWDSIEDRTRNLRGRSHWDHPSEIIKSAIHSYHINMWENQPARIEVWVEKDALTNAIERPCYKWDVPFMACRGYTSASEERSAGERIRTYDLCDQRTILLYLGDHDPSGIDMTRDHIDRLALFSGGPVEVRRLALNMDQIEQYNPPPNPAKETDSRCVGYMDQFGESSWELDALSPTIIGALIEREIEDIVDHDLWAERTEKLNADKAKLTALLGDL